MFEPGGLVRILFRHVVANVDVRIDIVIERVGLAGTYYGGASDLFYLAATYSRVA